ncbi:MAG: hypothetical protein WDN09_01090 [bacterium]
MIALVNVRVLLFELPLQSSAEFIMKYALYIPGVVGAVIVKLSVVEPEKEVLSSVLAQVVEPGAELLILHFVPCQSVLELQLPVTAAVIEAPGCTVTVLKPFKVAEVTVVAANAVEALENKNPTTRRTGNTKRKADVSFFITIIIKLLIIKLTSTLWLCP